MSDPTPWLERGRSRHVAVLAAPEHRAARCPQPGAAGRLRPDPPGLRRPRPTRPRRPRARLRISALARAIHWERSRLSHHVKRMEARWPGRPRALRRRRTGQFRGLTPTGSARPGPGVARTRPDGPGPVLRRARCRREAAVGGADRQDARPRPCRGRRPVTAGGIPGRHRTSCSPRLRPTPPGPIRGGPLPDGPSPRTAPSAARRPRPAGSPPSWSSGIDPNTSPENSRAPTTAPMAQAMRTLVSAGTLPSDKHLAQAVLDVLVAGVVLAPVEFLDGRLVPFVEDEQRPLLQHLVDQAVEQPGPRCRRGVVPHGVERLTAELVEAQVERHQDVGLAGEVVVDRRLGEAEPVGDLAERRLVVALRAEQLEGDVEDALPGRRRADPSRRSPDPRAVPVGRPGPRSWAGFYLTTGRLPLTMRREAYLLTDR